MHWLFPVLVVWAYNILYHQRDLKCQRMVMESGTGDQPRSSVCYLVYELAFHSTALAIPPPALLTATVPKQKTIHSVSSCLSSLPLTWPTVWVSRAAAECRLLLPGTEGVTRHPSFSCKGSVHGRWNSPVFLLNYSIKCKLLWANVHGQKPRLYHVWAQVLDWCSGYFL